MTTIEQVLMSRDGMSSEEARDLIAEAREELEELVFECDLEGAYTLMQEYFGLEPDYLLELL